jgi:hypothetical protein
VNIYGIITVYNFCFHCVEIGEWFLKFFEDHNRHVRLNRVHVEVYLNTFVWYGGAVTQTFFFRE